MLLQTIISTLFLAATATAFQWPLRGNQLLGWFEDFKEGEVPQKYRSGNSAFNGTCDTLNLFRAGVEGFLTLSAYCLDSHANNSTRYLTELNLNRCLLNYDGQLSYSISSEYYADVSCTDWGLYQSVDNQTTYLAAACRGVKDTIFPTYVELGGDDELNIHPVNGRLTCGVNVGTKINATGWGEQGIGSY